MKQFYAFITVFLFSLFFGNYLNGQTSLKNKLKIADSLYFSDPDASYHLSIQVETIASKTHDQKSLVIAKIYEARYLLLKSSLDEAMIKLNQAIEISSKYNLENELAQTYKLKSILLKRLGKLNDGVLMQEKALSIYRKTNNKKGLISILINLSLGYIDTKQFELAQTTLNEIENSDSLSITNSYFLHQNKGKLQVALGHYDIANKEFYIALAIAESNKMYDSQATILMEIGKTYRLNKEYQKASEYLTKSEALCVFKNMKHELVETYEELILLNQEIGNYDSAFHLLKTQTELKNEILNIEKLNKINELEKKLALFEKEKEIEKEKENTQKAKAQNLRMLYGIFGIGLFTMLLVLLFFRTNKLKNQIQLKSNIIEEKQKEIVDSINYAKRIQSTLLVDINLLSSTFNDCFVLFKPKDIVSGDFYWATEHNNKFYLAVCDCTGHGVPGAFMSLLNIGFLGEAIKEKNIEQPHEIFNYVRSRLINTISKEGQQDGMDGILLCLDKETNQYTYAAANNEPVLITNNQVVKLPKDKMPIGKGEKTQSFTLHTFSANKGDTLYLYTDGYADQFGGDKGKKFKYNTLNEKLLSLVNEPIQEQKQKLTETLEKWKGNLEQVDDVLIFGLKL
jgi:serine phosphatase RsbU (regulator of sigma subunit)